MGVRMGKKPTSVEKVVVEACVAEGCKTAQCRYSFCEEHFEQFKFGLVTKFGKKVSDYDRKIDHYLAFKRRSQIQKAA